MALVYDYLVLGTGLAGLSYALKVAEHGKVCVVTKTKLEETNTSYAQGGIAAVIEARDSFQKHINDTLICGDGICDEKIVEMVVSEAPEAINELIGWGTNFDTTESGSFDLHKEGGHSEYRILHHKDITGFEIQRAISKQVREHPNIDILEYHFAVDIITQHHLGYTVTHYDDNIECYGAYVLNLNDNQIETVLSKVCLIATGGIGSIYQTSTNPVIATGDGIAMVYRAKGHVKDMEFVQLHPTSLYNPNEKPSFLITEALRGFGAVLRGREGEEFMHKYDKRGSLAPRDIVARAIDNEMKLTGDDCVYLDATECEEEALRKHFPNIFEKCLSLGIDISKDYIPVVPAAHFMCGGIKVDATGRTTINRLYAAGEVSCTGLHGANRLASNSLLEAVIFARKAAEDSIANIDQYSIKPNIPVWNDEGTSMPEEMVLITQEYKELQMIMSNYVGIVRSNLRLKRAYDRLEIIFKETEELFDKSTVSQKICELRNSITVAYLIIKAAKRRKESRGLHYTIDYPKKGSYLH